MPTVQICGVSASYAFTNWSLLRLSDCARTLEEEAAPELGGHMKSGEQRRGSVLPPNTGYVQWFKIEIFTVSTKWTFICNFENLSKVALWVSFEPYRSVSTCLLFPRCAIFSHAFHSISPKSWWNKNTSLSSAWNHKHVCVSFSCRLGFIFFLQGSEFPAVETIKALHQFWPFPTLRKQPPLLKTDINGSGRKYSYHLPLRERRTTKPAVPERT